MRRVLGGLLIVVVSLAAVAGGVFLLQSRDDAEVGSAGGPGERVEDRCPDEPAGVTRDRRRLSEAQIRTALSQGNVVILSAGSAPAELLRLQEELTGPFDAEIAAAGQMVILAEGGRPSRIEARAWGRRLVVEAPRDQRLRQFTEARLGEGAPEPCR